MEQTIKQPIFKSFGESLLVFVITVLLCAAAFVFIPAVVLIPVPMIFIAVRRGFFFGFLPLALSIALCWGLFGTAAAAVFAAMFVPAVFIVAYALQKKARSFEAVVFSVGAYALGLALVVAFFYFAYKTDAVTYIVQGLNSFMQANTGTAHEFLLLLNLQDILDGAQSMSAIIAIPEAEAVKAAVEGIRAFIQNAAPLFLSAYSVAGGLVCYVITRAFLKKKGVSVAPIPAFASFRLPKGFFMGMAAVAVLFLLGGVFNIPNFDSAFQVCYVAYIIVFIVAGLSLTDFLLRRRNMGKGGRIAILIIAGLLFSFILIWMGILDMLFKIKERIEKPDEFDGE